MKANVGKTRGFKNKLRRAFTITELVIVIAVIAILAAVLIPTFSNVINNSKKSHDEQYVKEINVALSGYTNKYGRAPKDYQELMLALSEYDLCDATNPFLLATALKQDDKYLIWYENANAVVMLDSSDSSEYIIQFTSSIGHGNAVYVFDKTAAGGTQVGYALCNIGMKDGKFIADLYYDIYVEAGGDLSKFIDKFGSKYTDAYIKDSVKDQAWGNSIISSITNQKNGYTASESIANNILEQSKNSSDLAIDIKVPENYEQATSEEKKIVETQVRSALATLTRLANSTADAEVLQNKKISLGTKTDALKGVAVDMSEVQMTAIGNVYRKTYEGRGDETPVNRSSFSVDFSGLTIQNMVVAQNELVSSGAEFQPESDNSYPGGAYVFTYGLFGTINAEPGETVTVSNLTIDGVDMNLNGASESINGKVYPTITDMAGVVAGYTQGNVTFENIKITGKDKGNGEYGEFTGFDGVAAIVGRSYASKSNNAVDEDNSQLIIRNCHVSNLNVNGQRRATGFVGYAGVSINVTIENSSLTNMKINCKRTDGKNQVYSATFGHFADTTSLTIKNVTLTDIVNTVSYGTDTTAYIGLDKLPDYLKKCYYLKPTDTTYLLLILADDASGTNVFKPTVSGDLKVVNGGVEKKITQDMLKRGTQIKVA